MMNLKILIWKLSGNTKVCPLCKSELLGHFDMPREDYSYSCINKNCDFNK